MTATRRDGLVLSFILATAAVLRLFGLSGRGEWDDDQGDELLTMLHWVRDGRIPDLGPAGSFGTAHHGVAYYWLLAPGAYLTDASQASAAASIALIGVAGVAATWWLGRTVGGPLAGHASGLLMALSPTSISASTFIWNSNIVGPATALAAAGGWHAWRNLRPMWWTVAAIGLSLAMQGHLLAALAAPPLIALVVADVVRRAPGERREMMAPVIGAVAVIVILHLPLIVHELRSDFSETRAIAEFVLRGTGRALPEPVGSSLAAVPVIAWRALAWPVAGFVLASPLAGFPAVFFVAVALAVTVLATSGTARQYGCWAVATTIWAIGALAMLSPSLGVITPGLPNDQYHAWLDPILLAAVGVAAAQLWNAAVASGRVVGAALVVGCLALGLVAMPPLEASDGGWPAADVAADRIHTRIGEAAVGVTGVAKSGAALAFPLERSGANVVVAASADYLVVVCDPLFERSIGAPCGGPAETAVAHGAGFPASGLVDHFSNSPRRVVCVFRRSRPTG